MIDGLDRRHLAWVAALLVVAALVAVRSSAEPAVPRPVPVAVEGAGDASDGREDELVVHVAGAVRRPGVYRLRSGLRVDDAVRRAGGPTRRADLSALNLAARVEDERQVLVPARAKSLAAPGSAGGAAAPATAGPAAPINLNTATLEQLDTLEGIGPTTAQKILDWRTENGGFADLEELGRIPGIGEKRMATLRARLTL